VNKKYIFIDLDGTIIDHSTNSIPESTKKAINLLQEKGHEIIIASGRAPALFYGIDKTLNIDSYIASNGRIVVYKDELIHSEYIDKKVVDTLVKLVEKEKIDLAFESMTDYVLNTDITGLSSKFSEVYHLKQPEVHYNYHLENDVYQMVMFYTKDDYKRFEELFPTLSFHFSNKYGIDINAAGGMKEIGMKRIIEEKGISIEDTIAVGDGLNDISMIKFAHCGIAMGNAQKLLKEAADIIADDVNNDGFYKVFKKLKMI
jgi:Cof subfamily protein (haloacid dehalogenase superfamily)